MKDFNIYFCVWQVKIEEILKKFDFLRNFVNRAVSETFNLCNLLKFHKKTVRGTGFYSAFFYWRRARVQVKIG